MSTTRKSTKAVKRVATKSPGARARSAGTKVDAAGDELPASTRIDRRIAELGDWRGPRLAEVRRLVHEADPEVVEEVKWRGVPVWSHAGILCTGETYRSLVKLTFAHGAALPDPARLFNASLEGGTRRAIDLREGDALDPRAFRALVRAAVARNLAAKPARPPKGAAPKLLAGGNPRIPKGDGDAPVRAYLAALSGWRRDVARRLDALVLRTVPDARRAIRWNSPFYGLEGRGWFVSFHVFSRAVKLTFFRGTSLRPPPPGGKSAEARWIDLHEDDFDETRIARWLEQAAALPGWGGS